MLKFYFSIILGFTFIINTNAQCLKGDCKNGYGEKNFGSVTYKGAFKNGLMEGKGELITNDNSESYNGGFIKGKFHGKGEYKYLDGSIFQGEYKNGLAVYGTLTFKDGRKFEGEFKEGKYYHGKGTYYYSNGDIYEGQWEDGVRKGQCTFTFDDGRKYEGENIDGMWHGKGKFHFTNGSTYNGDWVDGKMTGKGIYIFGDQSDFKGHKYEGEILEGKWHGKGKYYYANGDVYEGEILDGKWNGKGTFYYSNGSTYSGDWLNNQKSGNGILTWQGGNKFEGNFENDYMKNGKFYRHNELIYEGEINRTWSTAGQNWLFLITGSFVQLLDYQQQIASIRYDNGDYFIGKVYNDYLGVLDQPNGEGIMIYAYGKAVAGIFNTSKVATKITDQKEFKTSKAELWYRYGTALKSYQGWALAELEYKRALNLEPNNQTYQFALLEALMKQAKYDDANKIIETILSKDSKNAYAINSKAIIFYDQKEYVKAISQFDMLIKSDSKNYNYIYSRGLCHFNLKNYKKAINDFTAAIKIEETSNAFFYRGQCYLNNSQKTEACEDFQKAKQMGQKAIDSSISAACN